MAPQDSTPPPRDHPGAEHRYLETRDPAILDEQAGRVVLFRPFIPPEAPAAMERTLRSRWVGEGPRVKEFEPRFAAALGAADDASPVAVGSGTDALHLAYMLAGIGPGDEVITPVFTCTATNLPLIYLGAKPRFADIEPNTLNVCADHVRSLVNDRTKAIVCVHYGGLPCDLKGLHAIAAERGIPVIEDAAQAIGAKYRGRPVGALSDYTIFSFQAIKHFTTGDGGMLMIRRDAGAEPVAAARRIRWFGIDREAKFHGHWENDIREVGYKYQMTDIAATLGLAALPHLPEILRHRQSLLQAYDQRLRDVPGIHVVGARPEHGTTHAAWLCTVRIERRKALEAKLREHGVESAQVHFRNDRYTVFAPYRQHDLPHMDAMEDHYQVLPIHPLVTLADVERICDIIKAGW